MTEKIHKHPIDELFKSKLIDYEETPPLSVWGKVSDQLNRRKRLVFWKTFTAMAASFTIIVATYVGFEIGKYKAHKQISEQSKNIYKNEKYFIGSLLVTNLDGNVLQNRYIKF